MSSIGYSKKLKCFTPKCGKHRPYWSDFCKRCRLELAKQNPSNSIWHKGEVVSLNQITEQS